MRASTAGSFSIMRRLIGPSGFLLQFVIPFRDGLMAGERFYYDLATLLRQIGVMPPLSGE
jgi:hypothetical protein